MVCSYRNYKKISQLHIVVATNLVLSCLDGKASIIVGLIADLINCESKK